MILILGGTTEGRAAVRVADEANQPYFYSTKGTLQEVICAHGTRLTGAMDVAAMRQFCAANGIRLLIDAAHPFASALHQTIAETASRLQLPVIRLERRYPPRDPSLHWCENYADAIRQMEADGVEQLLALSGVNTIRPLKPFWEKHPCWFRILDREESLRIVEREGFPKENLLFYKEELKTSFSEELTQVETWQCRVSSNQATALLTKESGYTGGFVEKVEAAKAIGIPVYVVKRPALPETFYFTYGEEGLRKWIERLLPDFFPLKSGYTTGCCATAAAKAALLNLLTGERPTEIEIALPSGEWITLPIEESEETRHCHVSTTQVHSSFSDSENFGFACVRKESGDDPDVTNHALICATVSLHQEEHPTERIRFRAGEGVGTVTLPGLGLPIGDPAINATPRRMIQEALLPLLPSPDTVATVTISVPGGAELAKRTFNPKLGIEGGISIIGTSGIVRPFSSDAFIASIRKEANVAKAIGCETLVINSGAKSERILRGHFPDLPPQAFVHYGNFIGETLRIADEIGFKQVVMGIMLGKAVKLAEGSLDTHSKKVVMNRDFLKQLAIEANCPEELLPAIDRLTLARELWEILPSACQSPFCQAVLNHCAAVCAPLIPHAHLTLLLIREDGKVIP